MDSESSSMVAPTSIPTPPAQPGTTKITLRIPTSAHASPRPPPPPHSTSHQSSTASSPAKQHSHHTNLHSYPSPPIGEGEMISSELLERELPDTASDDLVPLNILVDQVIRDIYQRLGELGEILPSLHESARAPQILQFALYSRRQVVKLLALVRWSKESEVVAKCLNITSFLTRQNAQFDEAFNQLEALRNGLDATRVRNPDLLTALDLLTTGTYQRLPQRFQTDFLLPSPLTDKSILRALLDLNYVVAYRLKVKEVVPIQMMNYRIADGRAFFSCPGLFEASFSLTGAQKAEEDDSEEVKLEKERSGKLGGSWYLVELAFSYNIAEREDGVDEELRKEFPSKPPRATFDEISYHATGLLVPLPIPPPPSESAAAGGASLPDRLFDPLASHVVASPYNASGGKDVHFKFSVGGVGEEEAQVQEEPKDVVVDAPLVRVFNLLQSLSLTYQLEILFKQAQRIRSLGWADCFTLEMDKSRKSFKISYWPRSRPVPRSQPNSSSNVPPPTTVVIGGTFTVCLVDRSTTPSSSSSKSATLSRILNEVEGQVKSKMIVAGGGEGTGEVGAVRVSDKVLETELCVVWEAEKKWSPGVDLSEGTTETRTEFRVDSSNLDLESILLQVVRKHSNGLLRALYRKLIAHQSMAVLYDLSAGDILFEEQDDDLSRILVRIHGDEYVTISMDPRSGRISARDAGDVVPSEDSRLVTAVKAINQDPQSLSDLLIRLKLTTVTDDLDLKFSYLGLNTLRKMVFKSGELLKFGPASRLFLFVPLPDSPTHFFVAVMTQATFRFALLTVRQVIEAGLRWLVIDEIGWLDDEKLLAAKRAKDGEVQVLGKRKFEDGVEGGRAAVETRKKRNRFYVDVEDLRELYSYCLARVACHKVEQQLKSRHIPYELVSLDRKGKGRAFSSGFASLSFSSPMEASVPIISVQARDLLKGVPAAVDVALPNIQMRVRNWWGEERCQVVTSIKLRQQPTLSLTGRKHETMSSPSRNVLIDTSTSVVSFVTENIEGCVDTLTEEFSRVGKLAVIASEINRSKDPNLKMTYFDLQTATFIYAPGLIVSIGWYSAPLRSSSPGTYNVTFELVPPTTTASSGGGDGARRVNPHSAMATLFRDRLNESDEAGSLLDFIQLLRTTLPLLQEAEDLLTTSNDGLSIRLWPKSVSCFCFVFEKGSTRHALLLNLILSSPSSSSPPRYLIQDAARSPPPNPSKRIRFHPVPGFLGLLESAVSTAAAEGRGDSEGIGLGMPPVMGLSEEEGLMCEVGRLRGVLGGLASGVRRAMAREGREEGECSAA